MRLGVLAYTPRPNASLRVAQRKMFPYKIRFIRLLRENVDGKTLWLLQIQCNQTLEPYGFSRQKWNENHSGYTSC